MLRTLANEPTDPIEKAEPTDPMEANEFTDPMESIELREAKLSRECAGTCWGSWAMQLIVPCVRADQAACVSGPCRECRTESHQARALRIARHDHADDAQLV